MLKEINGPVYRIRLYTDRSWLVQCDTEDELAEYVFNLEQKGYVITSVTSVEYISGSITTPKVAIKSNKRYKELFKACYRGNK